MRIPAFVVVLVAVAACQTASDPVAGVWQARFEGQTFIRLELVAQDGAIRGSMSTGHFEVDKQGAVQRADGVPSESTPLLEVTRRGAIVAFSRKDQESVDRFEFRLLDGGRGELTILFSDEDRAELAAEGIPEPRPIAMTRG